MVAEVPVLYETTKMQDKNKIGLIQGFMSCHSCQPVLGFCQLKLL
jgi:hypothetical protein